MWILFLSANLWASDAVTSAIEQAQSLALKKNRQQAAQVLNDAIAATVPPLKGRSRLIEAEANIAKVFFTDKGQRLYESGQSAIFENPDMALSHFREALPLEDNNVLVLDGVARAQMMKQDCAGAAATLQPLRKLFPFAAEPALLELRALVCQKNFESFRDKLKTLPPLEKSQEAYVQYLVAQDLLQQKMWRKASEVLNKLTEEEPQFPEPYYLLTRAGVELNRDIDQPAQKYVSLCKAAGVRERKRFELEPRLCANAKEMEDELAKKATDI